MRARAARGLRRRAERPDGADRELLSFSLAEFQTLDAGWGFTQDDGATHPERGTGLHVPSLEEFLAAFPDVPVLLDVKPETAEMADALTTFARDRLSARDRRRLYIKSNDETLPGVLRAIVPEPLVAFRE